MSMSECGGEVDLSVPSRAIGEPARGRMLTALLGGRSLPAGELARLSGVAPSTASEHLRMLVEHGLLSVSVLGRHRYFTLASVEVAQALEALQAIAPPVPVRSLRQHRVAQELRGGRRCYDHLAGSLGLRVTDLLLVAGVLPRLQPGQTVDVLRLAGSDPGVVQRLNLDAVGGSSRRPMVRGCLDWTERRAHLGGRLGAHLLDLFCHNGWVVERPSSRAVRLTEEGAAILVALEAS